MWVVKLGNKEKILKILKQEDYTASELANKTDLTIDNVKTYLQRLKKEGLIRPITKKGREFLFTATEKRPVEDGKAVKNLKFLNDFFKENLDYLLKDRKIVDFVMSNEIKFNEIERLVKDV